jgi:hypothetical protein
LGTKITEWKDVEKITDKEYESAFVDYYRIKNPSFSSTLKDFTSIVLVQRSTSLTYKIQFEIRKKDLSSDEIRMLEKTWQTLKAGLVDKYKDPVFGSIYEADLHTDKWKLNSDSLDIFLIFSKEYSGKCLVQLTYCLNRIETIVDADYAIDSASKRLGIDLSDDPKKKRADFSKEVP